MMALSCSRCGNPRDRKGQRYCRSCHAAYAREWRQRRMLHVKQRETVRFAQLVSRHARGPVVSGRPESTSNFASDRDQELRGGISCTVKAWSLPRVSSLKLRRSPSRGSALLSILPARSGGPELRRRTQDARVAAAGLQQPPVCQAGGRLSSHSFS